MRGAAELLGARVGRREHPLDRLRREKLPEYRCLEDAEADPQADAHQDNAKDERYAPTPCREIGTRPATDHEDHQVRQE